MFFQQKKKTRTEWPCGNLKCGGWWSDDDENGDVRNRQGRWRDGELADWAAEWSNWAKAVVIVKVCLISYTRKVELCLFTLALWQRVNSRWNIVLSLGHSRPVSVYLHFRMSTVLQTPCCCVQRVDPLPLKREARAGQMRGLLNNWGSSLTNLLAIRISHATLEGVWFLIGDTQQTDEPGGNISICDCDHWLRSPSSTWHSYIHL